MSANKQDEINKYMKWIMAPGQTIEEAKWQSKGFFCMCVKNLVPRMTELRFDLQKQLHGAGAIAQS